MSELTKLILDLNTVDSMDPDKQYKAAIKLGVMLRKNELAPKNHQLIVTELINVLANEIDKRYGALTRAHAAEALDLANERNALKVLMKRAEKDEYQLVRSYATRGLGNLGTLGDEGLIKVLSHVLVKDEFFGARAEAAKSIGKICKTNPHAKEEINGAKDSLIQKRGEERKKKADVEEAMRKRNEENTTRILNEINAAIGAIEAMQIDETIKKIIEPVILSLNSSKKALDAQLEKSNK